MRKYHVDGIKPKTNQVFVFGSNLLGVHGAGAARAALSYNAVFGCGVGYVGNSYAIPTKGFKIETLPFNEIEVFVNAFCEFTKHNRHLDFFVTRVGCGLAGLKDEDMAPLFRDALNCSFAQEWAIYLD